MIENHNVIPTHFQYRNTYSSSTVEKAQRFFIYLKHGEEIRSSKGEKRPWIA